MWRITRRAVPSVEPSSTTIISAFQSALLMNASSLSSVASRRHSSLKAGITMLSEYMTHPMDSPSEVLLRSLPSLEQVPSASNRLSVPGDALRICSAASTLDSSQMNGDIAPLLSPWSCAPLPRNSAPPFLAAKSDSRVDQSGPLPNCRDFQFHRTAWRALPCWPCHENQGCPIR